MKKRDFKSKLWPSLHSSSGLLTARILDWVLIGSDSTNERLLSNLHCLHMQADQQTISPFKFQQLK